MPNQSVLSSIYNILIQYIPSTSLQICWGVIHYMDLEEVLELVQVEAKSWFHVKNSTKCNSSAKIKHIHQVDILMHAKNVQVLMFGFSHYRSHAETVNFEFWI